MALTQRQSRAAWCINSDCGRQYASEAYGSGSLLPASSQHERKGNCYDNAVIESFWSSLKARVGPSCEWIHFGCCLAPAYDAPEIAPTQGR